MAKFKFEGIDDYITTLGRLGAKQSENVIKYAVYPGAGLAADAIRAALDPEHSDSGELAKSLTLVRIRNDKGYVNTKIMFEGYDEKKKSKQFPKGVPNAVKAASLESGNSRGQNGTHFISNTIRRIKPAVEKAMADALDEKLKQIMGD